MKMSDRPDDARPPDAVSRTSGNQTDCTTPARAQVAQVVNALPSHAEFVKQYAGASQDAWKIS